MRSVRQTPVTSGLRPMRARDVAAVARLHRTYQQQFKLTPIFSEAECAHWLLPRESVVSCFVVEVCTPSRMGSSRDRDVLAQDPHTYEVTDFTSFYALNSTVIGHPRHNTLNAAYAFYTASFKTPLKQLLYDALIMAKNVGAADYPGCQGLVPNVAPNRRWASTCSMD